MSDRDGGGATALARPLWSFRSGARGRGRFRVSGGVEAHTAHNQLDQGLHDGLVPPASGSCRDHAH
jgi:hypothetical protein